MTWNLLHMSTVWDGFLNYHFTFSTLQQATKYEIHRSTSNSPVQSTSWCRCDCRVHAFSYRACDTVTAASKSVKRYEKHMTSQIDEFFSGKGIVVLIHRTLQQKKVHHAHDV